MSATKEPRITPVSVLPSPQGTCNLLVSRNTLATDLQNKRKMTVRKQVFLKRKKTQKTKTKQEVKF